MARINDIVENSKLRPKPIAPREPDVIPARLLEPPANPVRSYLKVVKGGRCSLRGQMVNIATGDRLDICGYLPMDFDTMRKAGMILEAEHEEKPKSDEDEARA